MLQGKSTSAGPFQCTTDLDIVHEGVVADFEGNTVQRRWVPDREGVLVADLHRQGLLSYPAACSACVPALDVSCGWPPCSEGMQGAPPLL
jgi:hypothetical protein